MTAAGPHRSAQRTGLVVACLGLVAFVALAWLWVPWTPVPGGVPTPVRAESVFTAAEIDRAEHYAAWARVWSWSALAISLSVACWLGFSSMGRRWAARLPGPGWVQVLVAVLALSLIGRLVTLPCGVALQQLRRSEGLATNSWAAWTLDVVKSDLVAALTSAAVLLVLRTCVRRWPRRWPAVAGGLAAGAVVLGSYAYPVVVEPLFNSFEPLSAEPLRSQILALAQTEGVAVEEVLVADASRRTSTLNAYVSGLGSSRRVVLYDTLVQDAPAEEVLAVVAHELAHAKYDDVGVGTALGAAGALCGVGLLGLILGAGSRREIIEAPGVPRILALAAIASLVAMPVQNQISRLMETRADHTALIATADPQTIIDLQVRLARRSHADPTPPGWSQWWFGSHPTVLQRVGLARAYAGDGAE